ncbi:hypothetical protein VTK26DRAFT_758 [Humicola hyalothermophila]
MRLFGVAMTSLREILVAALKSFLRGKSILQALLAFWSTKPAAAATSVPKDADQPISANAAADFLVESERLLLGYASAGGLKDFARQLKSQFREALRSNPACMLPSYNSQLPTGRELGQYLALDVGGSTLRVALVDLRGRGESGRESGIVRMDSFKIDDGVKNLEGFAFFDWMAERIQRTVGAGGANGHTPDHPLLVGLSWSFPIVQTSSKGGKLCGMGKGFLAAEGLLGQDLGDIIKLACQNKGLHVELSAIVNDSSATLLSEAYVTSSTRFGLILGTGVNIAAHLSVATIGMPKYCDRPSSWHERASHVIVNTELGMFGKDILPLSKWDKLLKAAHPRPDFQPLEQLVSGYYLGEICRLALVDAIATTGIFGGAVPPSLQVPYSLDTETLSIIESDTTPDLTTAFQTFTTRHPSAVQPTVADLTFLRTLSSQISRRSASIVAASLFALRELKVETERELLLSTATSSPQFSEAAAAEIKLLTEGSTTVAYTGSVIENYPGYRAHLQAYLDELAGEKGDGEKTQAGSIALVEAKESSLLGAAVALACVE